MKKYRALIISVLLLISSFILNWYSDEIFDALWVFALGIYIILIIIFVVNFILCILDMKKNKNSVLNIISIIILITIVLTVLFFPFRYIKTKVELILYEDERNVIIEKIKNNKLNIDKFGNASLPKEYKKVSTSGEVFIYKNENNKMVVSFWVFRGMVSGSAELIYSTGGEKLIRENEKEHPIISIKKMKDNWYYVITDY